MAHLYPTLMAFALAAHAADPPEPPPEPPKLSDRGWKGAKAALEHIRAQEQGPPPEPAEVCYRLLHDPDGYQLYEVEDDGEEEVTRPIAGAFGADLTEAALDLPDERRFDAALVQPIARCDSPDSGA